MMKRKDALSCKVGAVEVMLNYGSLTVEELKAKREAGEKFLLIDVREPSEYRLANIDGSILKPLGQIMAWMKDLGDQSREIVVYCHHGMRSDRACQILAAQGFTNIRNLIGGIDEWSVRIDPSGPRY